MKFITSDTWSEELPNWLEHEGSVAGSLSGWNCFSINQELFEKEKKNNSLDLKDILWFLGFEIIYFQTED